MSTPEHSEGQEEPEVELDLPSLALVQYVKFKGSMAAFIFAKLAKPERYSGLPVDVRVLFINFFMNTTPNELVRKTAQDKITSIESQPDPRDKGTEECLQIIKYLLANFDSVVRDAQKKLGGKLTREELLKLGILTESPIQ